MSKQKQHECPECGFVGTAAEFTHHPAYRDPFRGRNSGVWCPRCELSLELRKSMHGDQQLCIFVLGDKANR